MISAEQRDPNQTPITHFAQFSQWNWEETTSTSTTAAAVDDDAELAALNFVVVLRAGSGSGGFSAP